MAGLELDGYWQRRPPRRLEFSGFCAKTILWTPTLHLFLGIRKAQEPVCVQTFRPEAPVERLNDALSVGFPGREKQVRRP